MAQGPLPPSFIWTMNDAKDEKEASAGGGVGGKGKAVAPGGIYATVFMDLGHIIKGWVETKISHTVLLP